VTQSSRPSNGLHVTGVAKVRVRMQLGPRRAVPAANAYMKVFGFAGWSGSGKTVLIERLIPLLIERGLEVSLIKRAHHAFDVDVPAKDSYRHRRAGCREVLLSSSVRWAHMRELRGEPEQTLQQLVDRISPCDLLLVEGFKREAIPKIEVFRRDNAKAALHPDDPHVVAVASDCRFDTGLPQFDLDDANGIADFVCTFNRLG
jgi:molybdopterin-guanine dinucleotide biosynthesis adapter protein